MSLRIEEFCPCVNHSVEEFMLTSRSKWDFLDHCSWNASSILDSSHWFHSSSVGIDLGCEVQSPSVADMLCKEASGFDNDVESMSYVEKGK